MLDLAALALSCGLAIPGESLVTMRGVVMQESLMNPYAIGHKGASMFLKSRDEAVAKANELQAAGVRFDAGYGQISSGNFDWLGLSVEDVFDPCKNLAAAHRVLSECYDRAADRFGEGQRALAHALSCYNSGNFTTGIATGYVQKVAQRVVPELKSEVLDVRVEQVKPRVHEQKVPGQPSAGVEATRRAVVPDRITSVATPTDLEVSDEDQE